MKKKITALLLALTLLLSATALTGCGGGSGESSDGPVSLTLSLWDEAQLPVIQENVDAFNAAHEGEIKVNIEQIPWDTYWTKLDAFDTEEELNDELELLQRQSLPTKVRQVTDKEGREQFLLYVKQADRDYARYCTGWRPGGMM